MLWAIAVITFFPLYWLMVGSMKSPLETISMPPTLWPEQLNLTAYSVAWNELKYVLYFFNTVIIVSGDATYVSPPRRWPPTRWRSCRCRSAGSSSAWCSSC